MCVWKRERERERERRKKTSTHSVKDEEEEKKQPWKQREEGRETTHTHRERKRETKEQRKNTDKESSLQEGCHSLISLVCVDGVGALQEGTEDARYSGGGGHFTTFVAPPSPGWRK